MTNATSFVEFLKRVYDIFRPKFRNRVTWVLIVSGVGILSANPLGKV